MVKAASTVSSIAGDHGFTVVGQEGPVGYPSIDYADPLDLDRVNDLSISMTNRQLSRILFIAADTAARMEREQSSGDPMAWLFSPRRLFSGVAAVTACKDRDNFIRAIVLHGLSLGFDADPDEIDLLLQDDEDAGELSPASKRPLAATLSTSGGLPVG